MRFELVSTGFIPLSPALAAPVRMPNGFHQIAMISTSSPQLRTQGIISCGAAINARHYHVLTDHSKVADTGMFGGRGSTRDTSTLLDESGVIVVCADAELARLLRDFQWKELFWVRREQVRSSMGFYLFGHGLYEKALRTYIGMTGQGLLLAAEPEFFNWALERQLEYLDGRLSAYLSDRQHLTSTRELTPVPLLGIPGWAAENECAVYYDNKDYFRAGRHGRSAS